MLKYKKKQNSPCSANCRDSVGRCDTLKNNKSNKALRIGKNIVLILLTVGVIQIFFDEDPKNDLLGWLLLMLFWTGRGIYSLVISLKEGDKKSVAIDCVFVVFAVSFLVYGSINYFL
jgi:hypothetical protein